MNKKASKHVLIIDDDSDLQMLLKKFATNAGHVPHKAETVEEALKVVMTSAPHIIFLDINLKTEKTFGLIKFLKKDPRTRKIPIVAMSANNSKKTIYTAKELGADDFLIKPITSNMFIQKIKFILRDNEAEVIDLKNSIEVELLADGDITLSNDIEFNVISGIKFSDKSQCQISGAFLKNMKIENKSHKIIKESEIAAQGFYRTKLNYVGLSPESTQKLRNLKTVTKK